MTRLVFRGCGSLLRVLGEAALRRWSRVVGREVSPGGGLLADGWIIRL
jgi:hypothetical protein